MKQSSSLLPKLIMAFLLKNINQKCLVRLRPLDHRIYFLLSIHGFWKHSISSALLKFCIYLNNKMKCVNYIAISIEC
jgi:hypothetical protein